MRNAALGRKTLAEAVAVLLLLPAAGAQANTRGTTGPVEPVGGIIAPMGGGAPGSAGPEPSLPQGAAPSLGAVLPGLGGLPGVTPGQGASVPAAIAAAAGGGSGIVPSPATAAPVPDGGPAPLRAAGAQGVRARSAPAALGGGSSSSRRAEAAGGVVDAPRVGGAIQVEVDALARNAAEVGGSLGSGAGAAAQSRKVFDAAQAANAAGDAGAVPGAAERGSAPSGLKREGYFNDQEFRKAHPAPAGSLIYHDFNHSLRVAQMAYDFVKGRAPGGLPSLFESQGDAYEFVRQAALLHDFDPDRAAGRPARVPATLDRLRLDFEGRLRLTETGEPGPEGSRPSLLKQRFGWDKARLAMASAMIQRTEYPFGPAHPNPHYKDASPLARYRAMVQGLPPDARSFVLREGALLSEYGDKSSWYATESFEGAARTVDGLVNEINASMGKPVMDFLKLDTADFLGKIGFRGEVDGKPFDSFEYDRVLAKELGLGEPKLPLREEAFGALPPSYRRVFEANLAGFQATREAGRRGESEAAARVAGAEAAAKKLSEQEAAQRNQEAAERSAAEEREWRRDLIARIGPLVARGNRIGDAPLRAYLGAGDYSQLRYFLESDFYYGRFIQGRAPWTRWFYQAYRNQFAAAPNGRITRLMRWVASEEATAYREAIAELSARSDSAAVTQLWSRLSEVGNAVENAYREVSDLGDEQRAELEARARAIGSAGGISTGAMSVEEHSVLVRLYEFYRWVNSKVASGEFPAYYAQTMKGYTYRGIGGGELMSFAQWGVFEHDPLPEH